MTTTLDNFPDIAVRASGNHVHLTAHDAAFFFVSGITPERMLPNGIYWLANEWLVLIDPRGVEHELSVLGPYRRQTQVELSATDAFRWGFPIVRRHSMDHEGTPGFRLLNPNGGRHLIEYKRGLIVPLPHIHLVETHTAVPPIRLCTAVGSIGLDVRYASDVMHKEAHLTYDEWNALGLCCGERAWLSAAPVALAVA